MSKPSLTVYWDSSVFLAWLIPEPARRRQCLEVLDEAEAGKIRIVASTITLTEVIKLKGKRVLKKESEQKINDFFKQPYIVLHQVTRHIGEEARKLIWTYPKLNPKDSIHLATANFALVSEVHSFDSDLLSLDGQIGDPVLRICEPRLDQSKIPFDEPGETTDTEGGDSEDEEEQ